MSSYIFTHFSHLHVIPSKGPLQTCHPFLSAVPNNGIASINVEDNIDLALVNSSGAGNSPTCLTSIIAWI